jgi:glutamyl-tRNA synthetase
MAPSPTGFFHIGSARTTLFNYLFARHTGGTFVLRIEDTDQERSKKEFEQNIVDSIHWLGLDWDEGPERSGSYGPYYQLQRLEFYRKYAEQLLTEGKAYWCYCTPEELEQERTQQMEHKEAPKYSGKCRQVSLEQIKMYEQEGRHKALRFTIVPKELTYHDLIKGDITVDTRIYGDMVIMKADGTPTYNFACVADDHLMEFSHVIRGEDHISNTPKQVLLYEAFGWELPQFCHIPLILNKDRTKMSKRSGPTAVTQYQEDGYLPEALVNFLALMGWSPGTDQELFSLKELENAFTIEHVQSSPAIFNLDKLLWFNGQYIRKLSVDELLERLKPFLRDHVAIDDANITGQLRRIIPLVHERLQKLSEIWELVDFFFADKLSYDKALLIPKNRTEQEAAGALIAVKAKLGAADEWGTDKLEAAMRSLVEELGWKVGDLFMMVRIAVTGKKATPPLFETMEVLGKDMVVGRLGAAIDSLAS